MPRDLIKKDSFRGEPARIVHYKAYLPIRAQLSNLLAIFVLISRGSLYFKAFNIILTFISAAI